MPKAYEFIARGFTTLAYARDNIGERVEVDDARACCWCIYGALAAAYRHTDKLLGIVDLLEDHIEKKYGTHAMHWSDQRANQEMVLAELKFLDI